MPAPAHPSLEELRAILVAHYGLDGELVPHAGEEACNVEVRSGSARHMLKVLPTTWPHAVAELQAAAFEHVASRGCEPELPRLVRSKNGSPTVRATFGDGERSVFVTTFLEGRPYAAITPVRPTLVRGVRPRRVNSAATIPAVRVS